MRASEIYAPVRESLDRVERNLLDVSRLEFPFLAELLGHVLASRGKRLRPTIALLASRFSEHDHETTEKMATAVELLHIASLIHDDTVDGSATRHGRATISSVWGRDVAVQTGDYVFASAAALVCETGNIRVIRRFSQTIMDLATGQLREVAETHDPDGTREDYMARIYAKTASLFVVAAEAGAALSGASLETVEAMSSYGRSLGLAFQIVDDILDFEGVEDHIGKPVGSDLANGVLTLPTIIAMEAVAQRQSRPGPLPRSGQRALPPRGRRDGPGPRRHKGRLRRGPQLLRERTRQPQGRASRSRKRLPLRNRRLRPQAEQVDAWPPLPRRERAGVRVVFPPLPSPLAETLAQPSYRRRPVSRLVGA